MNKGTTSPSLLPSYHPSQVGLGELKGKGSFSSVYKVETLDLNNNCGVEIRGEAIERKKFLMRTHSLKQRFSPASKSPSESNILPSKAKKFSIRNLIFNKSNHVRIFSKQKIMAAKLPQKHENPKAYEESLRYLRMEANILSMLSHKNIIKIHGISDSIQDSSTETITCDKDNEHFNDDETLFGLPKFFIILECLSSTLDEKIREWAKPPSPQPSTGGGMKKSRSFDSFRKVDEEGSLQHSLKVLYDVASALDHLHKHNIIHRDIKPENIGFDSKGTVKLFDFGLALELDPLKRLADGTFDLEGGIGTCRYMAPEVASFETYNLQADVYSYGLLVYATLALTSPFSQLARPKWAEFVVVKGMRPNLDKIDCSDEMKCLIEQCWDADWKNRPGMELVLSTLDFECFIG